MMATGAEKLASPAPSEREQATNFWARADLVRAYSGGELRPVELALLERHREALSGRVLEIGVGGGRVTRHLCAIATEVHGIDVSATMVAHSRATCPEAIIVQRDLRDLSAYADGSFGALVAAFNVIDVLGHEDRAIALDGFARVLEPGGALIMSSHNLAAAPSVVGPTRQLLGAVRARRMRSVAAGVIRLPRRVANRRRMRPLERDGEGYGLVNDSAHDYSILHYYVSRDDQERQLAAHGFELVECLDLSAVAVGPGEAAAHSPELHYVARRG